MWICQPDPPWLLTSRNHETESINFSSFNRLSKAVSPTSGSNLWPFSVAMATGDLRIIAHFYTKFDPILTCRFPEKLLKYEQTIQTENNTVFPHNRRIFLLELLIWVLDETLKLMHPCWSLCGLKQHVEKSWVELLWVLIEARRELSVEGGTTHRWNPFR